MSASSDKAIGTGDAYDFLEIDGLLSDEELLLRDTVRQLVTDRILPEVGQDPRYRDLSLRDAEAVAAWDAAQRAA